MRSLHHEVHELDGYNQEFWKISGYSLKCVLELVASTSHAKVPPKASRSTGLSRNVFEDDFARKRFSVALSSYEQNKIACTDYQRHRPLNLSLDQKFCLLPQAHQNFEMYLMQFGLYSLVFMVARQQILMTAKSFDRMRLCFKTKLRFSHIFFFEI